MAGKVNEVREIRIVTKTDDKALKQVADRLGGLNKQLKGLSTASSIANFSFFGLLGYFSVSRIVGVSDEISLLANRINVLAGSAEEGARAMEGIVRVAKDTLTPLDSTATIYARMAATTKDLGLNTDQTLRLTKLLANSFRLSGASAAEATAASIQLSQGFASGQLRGQELRSVLEANVVLGQALADGLGVTRGELYKLAEAGLITAARGLDAVFKSEKRINDEAAKLAPTIGQTLAKAFVDLQYAVLKFNEKYDINEKFAQLAEFVDKNLAPILLSLATVVIPILIAKLGVMAAEATIATGGLNLVLAAAIGLGLTVSTQSRSVEEYGLKWKKVGLAIGEAGVAILDILQKLGESIPILGKAIQLMSKIVQFEPTKGLKQYLKGLREEIERLEISTESALTPVRSLQKAMPFDNVAAPVAGETGFKAKAAALTLEQQIQALNKQYLANIINLQEYNDAIDRLELDKLEQKFARGQITIEKFNEGVEKRKLLNLNRDLRDGTISLEQFNQKLRELELTQASQKFQDGKIKVAEYKNEIVRLKEEISFNDVLTAAVETYIESIGTFGRGVVDVLQNSFKGLEDAIFNFSKTGKLNFEDFVQSTLDELNRLVIRLYIVKNLLRGLEAGVDYLFNLGGPTGGGAADLQRPSNTSTLSPFTGNYGNQKAGVSASGGGMVVNISNNVAGAEVSARESQNADGSRSLEVLIDSRVAKAFGTGVMDRTMAANYGLRRKGG